ncbi:Uncharacterized protein FKW44_019207 [Caligus rogercresseyi]|uniref:Uncharacterized protein n=1 Tax=Caligus rogercresseyi TaxID=217165 RepID=A0A7T8JX92_CALRO|nr:Uncharacterized protein FKW44_019207 [Caligus rogercresseyi]
MSLDSVESNNLESPDKSPTLELKSITEAMDMVEDILADDSMERVERIDKLERILSRAMLFSQGERAATGDLSSVSHRHLLTNGGGDYMTHHSASPTKELCLKRDMETQTLSTGDIVMTKVFTTES